MLFIQFLDFVKCEMSKCVEFLLDQWAYMRVWKVVALIPIKKKWENITHARASTIKKSKSFSSTSHWNEEEVQQKKEWMGERPSRKLEWKRAKGEIDQMDRRWKWIFRAKCGCMKMCLSLNKGPIKYQPNWNYFHPHSLILLSHIC